MTEIWRPLQRSTHVGPPSEELVRYVMQLHSCDRKDALLICAKEIEGCEYWINDLYQVEVRRYPDDELVHLNIRRRDGYPGRVWRHFQLIKNQLVGPECEGIEIYPAESRLVDTSNKYHLYVITDPTFRWPFGFDKRDVMYADSKVPGLRQQPEIKIRQGDKGDQQ
jgi:hypothetical protein